jgi:hypothetical protein
VGPGRSRRATGADRGQLRTVADRDELGAGALHDLGEAVETVAISHASLVEVDRRALTDGELPAV